MASNFRLVPSCLALALALFASGTVRATPITVDGFALSVSESIGSTGGLSPGLQNSLRLVAQDRPMFSVANTSTTASITSMTLSLNNSLFAFASLTLQPTSSAGVTSYTPTTVAGQHAGANQLTFLFSSFSPNQILDFRADI